MWFSLAIIPFIGRIALAGFALIGYRLGIGRTRLLVVGAGRAGKLMLQHFAAAKSYGYHVVGFIHDLESVAEDFGRFRVLGRLDDLRQVMQDYAIGEVIIAIPPSQRQQIVHCIAACDRNGVRCRIVPDLHELSLASVDIVTIEGVPMFSVGRLGASWWHRLVKRGMDILGASCGLMLGAPIWLLIALLIRLDSRGPVIYSQVRVGQNGRTFINYKFRSMHANADQLRADLDAENKSGRGLFKLKRDPRCTRVGRWLRRLSLDEIPQLWNIVRGDMSLVGPRPPLVSEVARYHDWEKRRLAVPPGLTGLWQIRGRSDITFDEMVLMDLFYIENWSLSLDLQILFKTVPAVLFSRGAY
jgi:exopolysaccharide biosynthesis polyprenyl glycosylphosphotransferase